jgi:hypothetical protein
MKSLKRTKWFGAKEYHPMHVGWYEYRGAGIGCTHAYWTGAQWLWAPREYAFPTGVYICRGDQWRGLARNPRGL